MAKITQIREFDIHRPEQWKSHLGQVKGYLLINQIMEDRMKAAALLYISGSAIYDVAIGLFTPMPIAFVLYRDLVSKLNGHFMPKRLEMSWRFQFIQRIQRPSESTADFIADVQQATRLCKFPDLEDHLRDRITFGLSDKRLQQKLLAKLKISLQEVLDEVQVHEAASSDGQTTHRPSSSSGGSVHQETAAYSGSDDDEAAEIDAVDQRAAQQQPTQPRVDQGAQRRPMAVQRAANGAGTDALPGAGATSPKCAGCRGNHARVTCRFRSAKCRICGNTGHIVVVCRSCQRNKDASSKGTGTP